VWALSPTASLWGVTCGALGSDGLALGCMCAAVPCAGGLVVCECPRVQGSFRVGVSRGCQQGAVLSLCLCDNVCENSPAPRPQPRTPPSRFSHCTPFPRLAKQLSFGKQAAKRESTSGRLVLLTWTHVAPADVVPVGGDKTKGLRRTSTMAPGAAAEGATGRVTCARRFAPWQQRVDVPLHNLLPLEVCFPRPFRLLSPAACPPDVDGGGRMSRGQSFWAQLRKPSFMTKGMAPKNGASGCAGSGRGVLLSFPPPPPAPSCAFASITTTPPHPLGACTIAVAAGASRKDLLTGELEAGSTAGARASLRRDPAPPAARLVSASFGKDRDPSKHTSSVAPLLQVIESGSGVDDGDSVISDGGGPTQGRSPSPPEAPLSVLPLLTDFDDLDAKLVDELPSQRVTMHPQGPPGSPKQSGLSKAPIALFAVTAFTATCVHKARPRCVLRTQVVRH
jgi:hypothetical protein